MSNWLDYQPLMSSNSYFSTPLELYTSSQRYCFICGFSGGSEDLKSLKSPSSIITLLTHVLFPPNQLHHTSDLVARNSWTLLLCSGPFSAEEDVPPLAHPPTTVTVNATGSNTDQCASHPAWEPRRRRGFSSFLLLPLFLLFLYVHVRSVCGGNRGSKGRYVTSHGAGSRRLLAMRAGRPARQGLRTAAVSRGGVAAKSEEEPRRRN